MQRKLVGEEAHMFLLLVVAIFIFTLVHVSKKAEEKERIALEEKRREMEYQREREYKELKTEALKTLGFTTWDVISYYDEYVTVKSRQTLEKYDDIKFFKEDKGRLITAENVLQKKKEIGEVLREFLNNNQFKDHNQYYRLTRKIEDTIKKTNAFRVCVCYISSAGNLLDEKQIVLGQADIEKYKQDPSLLMSKGEYTKMLREQQKEAVSQKQREFYDKVNQIIDYANCHRDKLISRNRTEKLDKLVGQLFDRTVNSIKKIKAIDSEEWYLIDSVINGLGNDVVDTVEGNRKILDYYASESFLKVKKSCDVLMSSQREFNDYIREKVESISNLFGTRVIRNETINDDEYNYIRPYKKTITPFTAEVSATVFASAENSPLEYVVKNFYPNKRMYPEQIQKLYLLVEELETLREAKQIIENYKAEYQQYLGDVPAFILQEDEAGFYSRLGFAHIDESVLTVEYKFIYTSNGGMAQRSFTVPMTEETIAELIRILESKLTIKEFAREQRSLMTKKLRQFIMSRDQFTCCNCGNSSHKEPNLLLEIDHIVPIAKGGCTTVENLQTLCWKCNRSKGKKLMC